MAGLSSGLQENTVAKPAKLQTNGDYAGARTTSEDGPSSYLHFAMISMYKTTFEERTYFVYWLPGPRILGVCNGIDEVYELALSEKDQAEFVKVSETILPTIWRETMGRRAFIISSVVLGSHCTISFGTKQTLILKINREINRIRLIMEEMLNCIETLINDNQEKKKLDKARNKTIEYDFPVNTEEPCGMVHTYSVEQEDGPIADVYLQLSFTFVCKMFSAVLIDNDLHRNETNEYQLKPSVVTKPVDYLGEMQLVKPHWCGWQFCPSRVLDLLTSLENDISGSVARSRCMEPLMTSNAEQGARAEQNRADHSTVSTNKSLYFPFFY
uniref:Proteasome assembly chaperone 3 n=1 Tax=Angiostrongylus cantonensis TaxID=6313 RepID=A0A0K0CUW8_ANGCA